MTDAPTIAVDANGADAGPGEVARGAALAASTGVRVLLFGPAGELGPPAAGVEVIDAPASIAKAEEPARAVRTTPDASVVQAWRAVAEGRADAVVSGGSTGAALAAGLFGVKRARGIHRPALAILVPVPGSPFLLLDAGANVEVRAEHLVQFAHMGAAFMETAIGVARPRVALLSNGAEPGRGRPEIVSAHATLSGGGGGLNFIGNVEGFAIGTGAADVIVADGFTGNVALKVMEGTSAALLAAVRGAAMSSARARAARPARRDRSAGPGRGGPAGPAPPRRRPAWLLRCPRVRPRHRGGGPRGPRGRDRPHARAPRRRGRAPPRRVRGRVRTRR